MKPKIGTLTLGEVYAENEIKFLNNFEEFYYDINNAKTKILNKKKYVVIGRKGTGKTLLAHVVCELLKKSSTIARVESMKDFVFYELKNFNGDDVSATKYVPLFEWMLYVNMAKNIILNGETFKKEDVDILTNFLNYFGYIGGDLRPEKTVELTIKSQDNANGSLKLFNFGIGGGILFEESEKKTSRTYLDNLENLKHFIINILSLSKSKMMIFYDELDDKFSNNDEYKNGVISFLSALERTNNTLISHDLDVKVCAVIRSDIVSKLKAPHINRIFEDNGIFLNWDASNARESELFDMIAHKIKCSSIYYRSKSNNNILDEIIASQIIQEPYRIYILHRTLGRPRDIIRMLSYIQEEYGGNLERFEGITFTNTSKKYSSYLKREISAELIGHISDTEIENYFNFLSSIGKRGFTYNYALNKVNPLNHIHSEQDLKLMLSHLFKAGAICNIIRQGKAEGGNQYFWSYYDEDLIVNFDQDFEIHPGLWDVLKIYKPRFRLS